MDWIGWVRSNIGGILGWFGLYKRLQEIAKRNNIRAYQVMPYGLEALPDEYVKDRMD